MKFARDIVPKRTLCALDIRSGSVLCVIAHGGSDGFRILGVGEAPVKGIERGEITHLGDAVETVVSAIGGAEEASGARAETLYYNFSDANMRSTHPRVSKNLSGEGEIRASDIEEARKLGERLVSDFENAILYSKPVSFLIDDRDLVTNPIGVFGRKFDVWVHVLQAGSSRSEVWQKLIERAHFGKAVRVLSALSVCQGLFPKAGQAGGRIVADLNRDEASAFVVENGGLSDYASAPVTGRDHWETGAALAEKLIQKHPNAEVWLTGEYADEPKTVKAFGERVRRDVLVGRPQGISELSDARHASIAGLLRIAQAHDRRANLMRKNRGIFDNVKDKAASFIHEYF